MNQDEAKEYVRRNPEVKHAVIGSDGSILQNPDKQAAKKAIEDAGNEVVYPEDLVTETKKGKK